MAVLVINRSESYCLSCPQGNNYALPWEPGHHSLVGWSPKGDPCHEPWTAVTSDYSGLMFDNIEEHYFGFENLRGLPVVNRWELPENV